MLKFNLPVTDNLKNHKIFSHSLFILELTGLLRPKSFLSWKKTLYDILSYLALTIGCYMIISQLILIITSNGDFVLFFLSNIYIMITEINSVFKSLMIIWKRKEIFQIIDMCNNENWSLPRNYQEQKIIKKWRIFSR